MNHHTIHTGLPVQQTMVILLYLPLRNAKSQSIPLLRMKRRKTILFSFHLGRYLDYWTSCALLLAPCAKNGLRSLSLGLFVRRIQSLLAILLYYMALLLIKSIFIILSSFLSLLSYLFNFTTLKNILSFLLNSSN